MASDHANKLPLSLILSKFKKLTSLLLQSEILDLQGLASCFPKHLVIQHIFVHVQAVCIDRWIPSYIECV